MHLVMCMRRTGYFKWKYYADWQMAGYRKFLVRKALQSDKFFRMLSFREQAKLTLASVYRDSTAPFVKAAKAYLKGINEYIRSGKTPVEFTLAGIPKTPFTLEDMEIIVGYMGYTFVGAFKTESVATTIATKLGKDYLDDVMRNWPDSAFKIPVQAGEPDAITSAAKSLTYMANRLDVFIHRSAFPAFYRIKWLADLRKENQIRQADFVQ